LPSLALLHWLENMHQIFLYFYNSFRKFINYNKINNISYTGIGRNAIYVLGLPNTRQVVQTLKAGQIKYQMTAAWDAANGHGLPSIEA